MIRAFVGFFTTKKIHEHVERLEEEAKGIIKGKWTDPQNLHMTLQFIGYIDENKAVDIIRNIQTITETYKPFSVKYKSLGTFPSPDKPRILWIGVGEGSTKLKAIAKEIQRINKRSGINPDSKPFHPHVTICRIKEADGKKVAKFIRKYKNFSFGEETVERIALIKSTLTPVNPVYTVIEEFYLRGKKDGNIQRSRR